MISLGHLFEAISDSIEYSFDPLTDAPTKIWKAKMKAFQDRSFGEKLYDKFHPPQDNTAFEAAKKSAKEAAEKQIREKDGLKDNWYKK